MTNLNARDFLSSTFIKKADLKASGPQRLTIQAVESVEGLPPRNGSVAVSELQLVFADGRRWSLRAQINLRRMLEAFGDQTERWVNQTVELYFNPDVANPSGGEPGGIRLRIPETAPWPGASTFRSELEADLSDPVSTKTASRRAVRGKAAPDEVPF